MLLLKDGIRMQSFEVFKQNKHSNQGSYIFIGVHFQTNAGSPVLKPWIFLLFKFVSQDSTTVPAIAQTYVDIVKIPQHVTTNQGFVSMDVNFISKIHTVKVLFNFGAGHIKFIFKNIDVFPSIKQ